MRKEIKTKEMKNKYYSLLEDIIDKGDTQKNKKGDIKFLINQQISFSPLELDSLFDNHKVARIKLDKELELYMKGDVIVNNYKKEGIDWWDYCAPLMINTYPSYFKKAPALIKKINTEKRPSKNYVLFLGETGVKTNQLPCLSLIQFQIVNKKLHLTIYQRSADSSLGLPSDIYQMYSLSKMVNVQLGSITFFIGNAHIYENNIELTKTMLKTGEQQKFNLNV